MALINNYEQKIIQQNKDLMMKTYLESFHRGVVGRLLKFTSIPLFTLFITVNVQMQSSAQCQMSCFDVQVSLDLDCEATLTYDMVSDPVGCQGDFTVLLEDEYGYQLPSNVITAQYVGQTLTVTVIDQESGNSCWSNAFVEDKLPPTPVCDDLTLNCIEVSGSFPEPTAYDNCTPDHQIDVQQIGQDLIIPLDCNPLYTRELVREWKFTDNSGNMATCTQTILLERIDTSLLEFPEDVSQANGNALSCSDDNDQDNDGVIDPALTGVPTLDGHPLSLDLNDFCNTLVSFQDNPVYPGSTCKDKFTRVWTFREWCGTGEVVITMPQRIEIVDDEGPSIQCPPDFTVSTNTYSCSAETFLPPASVDDLCNPEDITVTITYPGGFQQSNGGTVDLPSGHNQIIYEATDKCLNPSTCTLNVKVEDRTAPIAVCDEFTTVSLGTDGTAKVYAETFDDGSYDECGIDRFEVRRMNPACGYDTHFRDFVEFSCCDIGDPIMVVMRVYDTAEPANFNECMVEITVQDKLPAFLVPPPSITLSCEYPIDFDNLDELGKVVVVDDLNDLNNPATDPRDSIILDDLGNPHTSGPTFYGVDGYAYDNCDVTVMELDPIDNRDQCGNGFITRTFVAMGPGGPQAQGTQTIFIENFEPFNPETDVIFPDDITITANAPMCAPGSATDPDNTGRPIIMEDICDQVAVAQPDDWIFEINDPNDPGCFKILRKWKIIDWCNPDTIYTDHQVIKVINTVGPTIENCDDVTVNSNDPNCISAFVELAIDAFDDCAGEDVNFQYDIDVNNDGSFDLNEQNNPFANPGNAPNEASGNYPIGLHRIVWTVEDFCGNATSCTAIFEIINTKKPTPFCYNGLSAALMPWDEDNDGTFENAMIELHAEFFDAGSFHPCYDDVTVSYSDDVTDTLRMFTCDDIGEVPVELYAHAPNGQFDFCVTFVDIQENMGICPDNATTSGVIAGAVMTNNGDAVPGVDIELVGGASDPLQTDDDGQFYFGPMSFGGDYIVDPAKNNDVLNGVTTYDLALIQRHVIGIELIEDPYKIIAADINNSKELDVIDVVDLRKVILGIGTEFPNNDSWRFIDANHVFTSDDPLTEDFNETYQVAPFDTDMMDVNFSGVKVGDINESLDLNDADGVDTRSLPVSLVLEASNVQMEYGKTYTIPVRMYDDGEILSVQFTLNASNLDITDVRGVTMDISEGNFGWTQSDRGLITFSWNDIEAQSFDAGEVLFEIEVTPVIDTESRVALSLSDAITKREAFTDTGLGSVELRFTDQAIESDVFELFQNRPNPFSDVTVIEFNLPKADQATLTIFTVDGRMVKQIRQWFDAGRNQIQLSRADLNNTGVMYYQLDTEQYTATKKMILQ